MKRLLVFTAILTIGSSCSRSAATAGGAPSPSNGAMAAAARPAAVTPAAIAMGDSLFNNGSCQRCHGKGGLGAANAPALNDASWLQLASGSFEEIVKIITDGVPAAAIKDSTHRFAMRPRGGPMNLTDAQIQSVAAYVYSLSHK
jgi:mono/diheme cytochrome c family protein